MTILDKLKIIYFEINLLSTMLSSNGYNTPDERVRTKKPRVEQF